MRRTGLIAILSTLVLLGALTITAGAREGGTAVAAPAGQDAPRGAGAEHVVVVDWDGFDPEYLDRVDTPVLDELARRGSLSTSTGSYPTISNPSRATMSTGAWPEVHGNIAYAFDRSTGRAFSQTRTLEAETIAEAVSAAGGTVASVQWYMVQNHGASYGDPEHLYVQPGGECGRRTDVALDIIARRPVRSGAQDVTVPRIPDLLALYCSDLDDIGHREGAESPPLAPRLAELDRQLGRLVQGVKDAGIYGKTAFVVTGDHGMTTFTRGFGNDVLASLRAEGFTPQFLSNGQKPGSDTDAVLVVGGSASVSLLGAADSPVGRERARQALERVPQVRRVYDQSALRLFHTNPRQGDLVAEPEPGWSFATADPDGPRGVHGTTAELEMPLYLSGRGVRRGVEPRRPRLVDVAPTVAALLGILSPKQTQGRALQEALKAKDGD